jgi:membrane peptidoglycan carboxypeptidase
MVPKETQLLIFVNTVYLGHYNGEVVRGFSQAAEIYFDKPFSDLTEEEYLSLVAMIIAPNSFNVKKQPQANAVRVQRIKRLLCGEYTPKGLMDLYYDK